MISLPTLLSALAAAMIYTFGVLLLKRSTDWSPGPWRTTFVCNQLTVIVFLPMLIGFGQPIADWSLMWQPTVVAACFVAGQTLVVLALTYGDVSVATPILGLKILIVSGLLAFTSPESTPVMIWIAGGLAVVAVACLGYNRKPVPTADACEGDAAADAIAERQGEEEHSASEEQRVSLGRGLTILFSIGAAFAYAIFDVMIQSWSPNYGAATFLPVVMIISGLFSCGMLPLFAGPLRSLERAVWPWLLGGAVLTGLQSLVLTYAIGTWGEAAAANVVYSSRGLWSVIAVMLVGRHFSRTEHAMPRSILWLRLLGATLISIAIALVL